MAQLILQPEFHTSISYYYYMKSGLKLPSHFKSQNMSYLLPHPSLHRCKSSPRRQYGTKKISLLNGNETFKKHHQKKIVEEGREFLHTHRNFPINLHKWLPPIFSWCPFIKPQPRFSETFKIWNIKSDFADCVYI